MPYRDAPPPLAVSLALLAVLGGVVFLTSYWRVSRCQDSCTSQYGSEWLARTGMYESCTCVGPDGEIKAPR